MAGALRLLPEKAIIHCMKHRLLQTVFPDRSLIFLALTFLRFEFALVSKFVVELSSLVRIMDAMAFVGGILLCF